MCRKIISYFYYFFILIFFYSYFLLSASFSLLFIGKFHDYQKNREKVLLFIDNQTILKDNLVTAFLNLPTRIKNRGRTLCYLKKITTNY